ncbi:NUDIX domain-containing protein [Nocardia sp. NPDC003963]
MTHARKPFSSNQRRVLETMADGGRYWAEMLYKQVGFPRRHSAAAALGWLHRHGYARPADTDTIVVLGIDRTDLVYVLTQKGHTAAANLDAGISSDDEDGRQRGPRHMGDWSEAPDTLRVAAITGGREILLVERPHYPAPRPLLQLPGGGFAGEISEEAAQRVLQAQTGYTATQWTYHGMSWLMPGLASTGVHLFTATGLTRDHENTEVPTVTMPFKHAVDEATRADGRLRCTPSAHLVLMLAVAQQHCSESGPRSMMSTKNIDAATDRR